MADNDLYLQLGDIIEIIAPTDDNLNNKQFFINYIDNEELQLLDDSTSITIHINPNKSLRNESITAIHILDRASELGYAKQNNLLINTWINIHFGGELPIIITGKITNLEEDQIEITNIEADANPIYIDFAYKGIPKDIPIEKIEIREAPDILSATSQKEFTMEIQPEDVPVSHVPADYVPADYVSVSQRGDYTDDEQEDVTLAETQGVPLFIYSRYGKTDTR